MMLRTYIRRVYLYAAEKTITLPKRQLKKLVIQTTLTLGCFCFLLSILRDLGELTDDRRILGDLHGYESVRRVPDCRNCIKEPRGTLLPHHPIVNSERVVTDYFHADTAGCGSTLCDLNREFIPVVSRTVPRTGCKNLHDCVTVTVKTKHRLHLVTQFIQSLHYYFPLVPVIVADEYVLNEAEYLPESWMELYRNTPSSLVTYIRTKPGMGFGRKLAANMVTTTYIMVADDDFIVTEKTNLLELLLALEHTDMDIAGGAVKDNSVYDGALRVYDTYSGPYLIMYPNVFYQNISTPYMNCYVSAIIKNFFLADRAAILKAGSWDESRAYFEHEDFFFTMRRARLKVAHCPAVLIGHNLKDRELAKQRMKYFRQWHDHLRMKWSAADIYYCPNTTDYTTQDKCSKPVTIN